MPAADGFDLPPATVTWDMGPDGSLCGRLAGEVDALNRDEVLHEVAERVTASAAVGTAVQIDLGDVAFCDARTLVGLARVVGDVAAAGGTAALTSVPVHLARILALVADPPEPGDSTGTDAG